MTGDAITLGAVAYDPKVVTIWFGFRDWFAQQGLAFDFVLYSNYETQVEELLAGNIDIAWNSPLAWVRARRLAAARGIDIAAVVMRDTDQDLSSLVVVRDDAPIAALGDLKGRTVGTGAVDSPQATLLPLSFLRGAGLTPGDDVTVRRFEIGVGLHGDHVGGERDAARALMEGAVDAACMIDGNHLAFVTEGTIGAGTTRVIGRTEPYDHCNMTVGPAAAPATVDRFTTLLLGMAYDDPEVRPLLDLEGLHAWKPGRTDGYAALEQAVDESGFYGSDGGIPRLTLDLADLGLDEGGHLLVARALAGRAPGDALAVTGTHPELHLHLSTWARAGGHGYEERDGSGFVIRGRVEDDRWQHAARVSSPTAVPDATWGFAARGALVEAGGPPTVAAIVEPGDAWVELAPQLYAQAVANQWNPDTAVAWDTPQAHPDDVEHAVVQVMTYLVENELAALVVPSRFIARIHPHFREVLQLLAVQCADEARHVEVFTRRARLYGSELGTSSAGGRASLHTLVTEPDYHLSTFLLSVLGEGSFLSLLAFIEQHAPDPVSRTVARLALQDEARHVAFGQAHLEHVVAREPGTRDQLRAAVERRHAALADTAGLNADVFDALVVLAAGSWTTNAIRTGWRAVQALQRDMDTGRRRRLMRLGFPDTEARALSELHTRNFM